MSEQALSRDLVETLRQHLAAEAGVRIALVFGSRARGNARASSDIDVAVVGRGYDRLGLAAELSRATELEVDVVSLDSPPIPLLHSVVREGVVVFERNRGDAASWRARVLGDLELDLLWYRRMRNAWLARVAESGL